MNRKENDVCWLMKVQCKIIVHMDRSFSYGVAVQHVLYHQSIKKHVQSSVCV